MLASAAEYYRDQQALSALAVRGARKAANQGPVAIAAQINAYQVAAVLLAEDAADAMLAEQEISTESVGRLNPAAFRSDGGSLVPMIEAAATDEAVDRLVATLVADAGRTGMGVATTARPAVNGHVRYLNPPSCARCAILAGRFYRWSQGFQRHPHCDCQMVPSSSTASARLVSDPEEAFRAGQIRGLSRADMQAINDGADLSRVVNVQSRAAGLSSSSSVISRSGRPSPNDIYKMAGSREESIVLLREHGYITATAPSIRSTSRSTRVIGDISELGDAADEVLSYWNDLTSRFPEVPGVLQVRRQANTRDGVVAGRAIALKTDSGFEIGGIEVSPRIGSEAAEKAYRKAVANGWFVPAPTNVAHTMTHEFGHLVDYLTGMKVSVARAQRRAWTAAGITPGPDVDLFLRREMSGYARTERAEAIAEAFADVELNGAAASVVNREIYDDLMRLLGRP